MYYRLFVFLLTLLIPNLPVTTNNQIQVKQNNSLVTKAQNHYLFGNIDYQFSDVFWGYLSQAKWETKLQIILPNWPQFGKDWCQFCQNYSVFGFDQTAFIKIKTKNKDEKLINMSTMTNQIPAANQRVFQFLVSDYSNLNFLTGFYQITIGVAIFHDAKNVYFQLYCDQYSLFLKQNINVAILLNSYFFY